MSINDEISNIVDKENIEKYKKIIKINPNFDTITKKHLNKDVINACIKNMPLNANIIKSYIVNYKKYNLFLEECNLENISDKYNSFYKLCFVLGFFHTGGNAQEETKRRIKKIIQKKLIITCYDLTDYYKEYADLLNSSYDELIKTWLIIYAYQNFNDIKKWHVQKNKYINRKKNSSITLDDIINYHLNHIFNIRKGNEDLLSVVGVLSGFFNQEQFDKIQDIYEKSHEIEKSHFLQSITEPKKNEFYYKWLASDDSVNLVLGYKVGSCATYDRVGQDIMIQSMNNISIKNLVVYNHNDIIAKTTCFYNKEKNYLLFNTIYVSPKFLFSLKTTVKDKNALLDSIIRGIKNQANICNVEEVRMGMKSNKLLNEIIERETIIEYNNLLDNYAYENYEGDANSEEGQAIILHKKHIVLNKILK